MDTRPAADAAIDNPTDEELARRASDGDRHALEALIGRYQHWIYNVALRMVYSPEDARDVTQDTLLKLITRLSTFKGRSSFRTWLYRVVANHVINMKARPVERMVTTFSAYGQQLDGVPDLDPPDRATAPADVKLMVEEAKIACMSGMLLCLDREQRLILVLGELFGVSDSLGGQIMRLSRANFRQRLSRARRDLYSFMNDKCGLVKATNPCRCARKTKGFIQLGIVKPQDLVFSTGHVRRIREVAPARSAELDRIEAEYADLFRDHPYAEPPDLSAMVRTLVERNDFRQVLDLD